MRFDVVCVVSLGWDDVLVLFGGKDDAHRSPNDARLMVRKRLMHCAGMESTQALLVIVLLQQVSITRSMWFQSVGDLPSH